MLVPVLVLALVLVVVSSTPSLNYSHFLLIRPLLLPLIFLFIISLIILYQITADRSSPLGRKCQRASNLRSAKHNHILLFLFHIFWQLHWDGCGKTPWPGYVCACDCVCMSSSNWDERHLAPGMRIRSTYIHTYMTSDFHLSENICFQNTRRALGRSTLRSCFFCSVSTVGPTLRTSCNLFFHIRTVASSLSFSLSLTCLIYFVLFCCQP